MYQPKTGQKCGCKRGVQRDNCANCEGTGWVVDFAAIRRVNEQTQTAIAKAQEGAAMFNYIRSLAANTKN